MPRVIETPAWREAHTMHLLYAVDWSPEGEFRQEFTPHPAGRIVTLVCPCGARHSYFEALSGARP